MRVDTPAHTSHDGAAMHDGSACNTPEGCCKHQRSLPTLLQAYAPACMPTH